MESSSFVAKDVFMVRPVRFEFNYQTAHNNVFQHEPMNGLKSNAQVNALKEFEGMVQLLKKHKIGVTVGNDTKEPHTPDSIFPTNWVSTLPDGTICLYPLEAKNRRQERKPSLLKLLNDTYEFKRVIDFTHYENAGLYLEGAASVIIDFQHKIGYSCLSDRTHKKLVEEFIDMLGIPKCIIFQGKDENGIPIYHSDVMMCVADKYVIICLDSIKNNSEKDELIRTIESTGKEIIPITLSQCRTFVGNSIQLENIDGEKYAIMSTRAFKSLTEHQRLRIEAYNQILHTDLSTIEEIGGGSAQCIMAKMYLKKRKSLS